MVCAKEKNNELNIGGLIGGKILAPPSVVRKERSFPTGPVFEMIKKRSIRDEKFIKMNAVMIKKSFLNDSFSSLL